MAEWCAVSLALHGGVWLGPSGDEEWTLCVSHTEKDIDRFIAAFEGFCHEVMEKKREWAAGLEA